MEAAQRQAFAAAGLTPERESTEWDDQLRKHGILPALPPKAAGPEPITYSVDNKDPDDVNDDFIDDAEYAKFRLQRLAELRAEAAKKMTATSEEVRQITKEMWQKEVTMAGDTYVLVHLFQPGNKLCDKVQDSHRAVARRHSHIKCVRIVATEAVPNYPARNIPTLLLYHRSDPVDQLVGPAALSNVSPEVIERFLMRKHALSAPTNKQGDSDEEDDRSD